MEVYIITPFPDSIKTLIDNNIANQGLKKGHLSIEIVNLRDFTTDNYKKIDDEPYGGGSGMVMMCEPLFGAIEYCISKSEKKPKIIFPSPKGKVLNHSLSSNLSTESSLIFICGHLGHGRDIENEMRKDVSLPSSGSRRRRHWKGQAGKLSGCRV